MKRVALLIVITCLAMAGCCKDCKTDGATAKGAGVPGFVVEQAKAGNLLKTKLYVGLDGSIVKFSAYVKAEALPDWLPPLADEKIGKGEFKSGEIEMYEGGIMAYEITRIVDGKKVELSADENQNVLYIERAMAVDELPAEVKAGVDKIEGFEAAEAESKEYKDKTSYEVEGKLNGSEVEIELDAKGAIVTQGVEVPGATLVQTLP
jgi:hypothetical protein